MKKIQALILITAAILVGCISPDLYKKAYDRAYREYEKWRETQNEKPGEDPAPDPGLPPAIPGDTSGLVKPVSEHGNLVILTPRSYRLVSGDRWAAHPDAIVITRLYIRKADGSTADSRQTYIPGGEVNGNRAHHRFALAGSAYGSGEIVAVLRAGGEKRWPIANFGARTGFR